ncbi:PREDICTED: guanylate-binding protein 5-like [Amphimedon queenslandica]|uniref:GB1/RHD3-type G domain-containing protein n=1 Tax=Amphimedon queenslandica TaxID=400682 RepID=A0AAN0JG56_AMPQE|nr:PREDICTED: guanylate-binding protein 5-like [Amphimedon queenslandica]|eukprot:XP_019856020.1 PREDICTED: guanylate-binding protein 5-like [Amphimedon queenslandica]
MPVHRSIFLLFFVAFSLGKELKVPAQNATDHVTSEPGSQPSSSVYDTFQSLPEEPIQLVRPDPDHHKLLEVVSENVRHLHYITSSVAVVAVVGKYHSGKSFLLNQLMGKGERGFSIGPTVRPQTMGIWMWGKPLVMKNKDEETVAIIYLDTEGFAASNISEVYDAKIFAVATILSSYLIYNSVKIIDQGDIDYLDLLARRTRLFALRSQITKSKWFDEFNHDLLQFPPLVWVVQDFVQSTEGEESPQRWLHKIMSTSSRETEEHNINLLSRRTLFYINFYYFKGMFESVDCHTLFLPATKKSLLQDLSQAKEEDLTEEYKEERDSLLKLINLNLKPKIKNGKSITGPELASLLEILVAAANKGSLAEVPSRWNAFLEQMHLNSVNDCILFYESEVNVLLRKHNYGAVNATELASWHDRCLKKAQELLDKLLLGLMNTTLKGQERLLKAAGEKFEKIEDMNEKKIELRCSEVQRQTELKVEASLDSLSFPIKGKDLQLILDKKKEIHIEIYKEEVHSLSDHSSYQRHLNQLLVGIERIFNGVKLKNSEAMEVILKAAIVTAINKFKESSLNINDIPRTSTGLQSVIGTSEAAADQIFKEESEMASGEEVYAAYQGYYKSELSKAVEHLREENEVLVGKTCREKGAELIGLFTEATSPKRLSFPVNESYLEQRLKEEKDNVFESYNAAMANFEDMQIFVTVKREISNKMEEISAQRQDQNYQAYIKEVEIPLKTAKKLIKLSSDKYDTVFSLRQHMEQVCLLNLDEGKASNWPRPLKLSIINRYINNEKDLRDLLVSKEGVWSSIKGFIQWLYSFIDVLINGPEL